MEPARISGSEIAYELRGTSPSKARATIVMIHGVPGDPDHVCGFGGSIRQGLSRGDLRLARLWAKREARHAVQHCDAGQRYPRRWWII